MLNDNPATALLTVKLEMAKLFVWYKPAICKPSETNNEFRLPWLPFYSRIVDHNLDGWVRKLLTVRRWTIIQPC